ncbi:Oidioi.mRNA.OKI2018_I69.chr1.g100.t1.cds [Oikopleura dioica]|uniref:Oidioi.mRNA.OKI2018_I69.chr1.g100.t1.cds n=1 Tax=Oikopleura dioica TaxID=34765 RepID=A0ABN7SNX1_OIKDI|nr:Oidioi.mRNA.OKI2018_I69.chr1.g100.t1.cds [Oikopleura dioica]
MKVLSATLISLSAGIQRPVKNKKKHDPYRKLLGQDRIENIGLVGWMQFYNPSFTPEKYWNYGCNCFIQGSDDGVIVKRGKGTPVDDLDNACKLYRDCLKCAREIHGESCIDDIKNYNVNIDRKKCRDRPGTCVRAVCECDAMFAAKHADSLHQFNDFFNISSSTSGWDPKTDCAFGKKRGQMIPKCCNSRAGPASIYNERTKECCSNGLVKPIGQCPIEVAKLVPYRWGSLDSDSYDYYPPY